ncbi:CaiB/BaiF CoA transferase family protein [Chloroflexota bacterium]
MTGSALNGIRVADFTDVVAGPYCTLLLAALGADIIHIDNVNKDDAIRSRNPARFSAMNMKKRSIAIDLKKQKGLDLAKKIIQSCDIVVENFRPGVMERLNLGYAALKEIKPNIIMVSASGYGAIGPESGYTSYATIFVAMSGLSSIIGYQGGLPNEERGPADFRGGQNMALSIMAALLYRNRTGLGQHIDLSISEVHCCGIGEVILDYTINNRISEPQGNLDAFMAPHNCYRCKGEDKWISIAIGSDEEWKIFCQILGNPEWTYDDRFADSLSRWKNQDELDKKITEWTITHGHKEIMQILQSYRIAAMPSYNSAEIFSDNHLRERGFVGEVAFNGEKHLVLGAPFKLTKTPVDIFYPAPLWGQHTDEICRDIISLTSDEIKKLKEEKVIK